MQARYATQSELYGTGCSDRDDVLAGLAKTSQARINIIATSPSLSTSSQPSQSLCIGPFQSLAHLTGPRADTDEHEKCWLHAHSTMYMSMMKGLVYVNLRVWSRVCERSTTPITD